MYSFTCCSSKLEAHTHNKAKEPKHRPKNADTHKHTDTKTNNMQGGKYNTFCVKMSGEWGKKTNKPASRWFSECVKCFPF